MPAGYRLKIVRAGQEFEAEGDKKFVLEMLARFEQAPAPDADSKPRRTSTKDGSGSGAASAEPSKGLSMREFIQRVGVKKHTEILVAFAYYLEKYVDVAEFTPADINNCYYEAKMETSNTSQMIIQNTRRGFVMPAKGSEKKGRYTLTASGEKFVEEKLASTAQ